MFCTSVYKKKVYRQVLLEMEVLKINISDLGQSVNITVWDGMEMEITPVFQILINQGFHTI